MENGENLSPNSDIWLNWASETYIQVFNNALLTNNCNSFGTNKLNLDHLLQVVGNMPVLCHVTFLASGCDY